METEESQLSVKIPRDLFERFDQFVRVNGATKQDYVACALRVFMVMPAEVRARASDQEAMEKFGRAIEERFGFSLESAIRRVQPLDQTGPQTPPASNAASER